MGLSGPLIFKMNEADLGRIITSKTIRNKVVYLSYLTEQMWAVTVIEDGRVLIYSRIFAFTKSTEDTVWEQCREHYNKVKDAFYNELEYPECLEEN